MSQEVVVQQKAKSLQNLLQVSKAQIEMALPKHLSSDRLLRIAMTEARKNPALLDCTQTSFIGAIIQAAQLGLEPGGALGHCYLLPFKNRDQGITEVQFIVGYRGMIDLAYRSPKVKKVIARAVYDKDKFSYDFGLDERLTHVPNQQGEGDNLTHVYCIVELENGIKLFDVMTRSEVEVARGRSKAKDFGPWKTDYEAMAKKSVVRRFFKFMPSSIEMQQAVGMDEAADRGEQHNGAVIEAVGIRVEGEGQSTTEKFKQNLNSTTDQDSKVSPTGVPSKGAFAIKSDAQKPMRVDPEPEQNGEFDNFDQTHVIDKIRTQKNHADLILEVVEAGKALGFNTMAKLSAECKKQFGKTTGDMTPAELETLLSVFEKEKNK